MAASSRSRHAPRLVAADIDDWSDVYVLDRTRQHVTLESADTGGYIGDSSRPGISGDGRYVVFERANVVMLRDRLDGVTRIIGEGSQPFITENGRTMLFTAGTVDSVTDIDVNGERSDIYSLDLRAGARAAVSIDLKGVDASIASSVHPAASSDGRYVAFTSRLQVDGKRAQTPHVFVRDTELNATRLVGAGWDPSLSGDGRFIAFVGLRRPVGAHIPGRPAQRARPASSRTARGAASPTARAPSRRCPRMADSWRFNRKPAISSPWKISICCGTCSSSTASLARSRA